MLFVDIKSFDNRENVCILGKRHGTRMFGDTEDSIREFRDMAIRAGCDLDAGEHMVIPERYGIGVADVPEMYRGQVHIDPLVRRIKKCDVIYSSIRL